MHISLPWFFNLCPTRVHAALTLLTISRYSFLVVSKSQQEVLRSNNFELIFVLTVRKFFDECLNCLFLDILPVNLTIESVIKTLLQPGNVWKVLSGTQLGFLGGGLGRRDYI